MATLSSAEARRRFATGRVARLASVTSAGHPHLVPITFALSGPDTVVFAIDHKPKRTTALARLANIAVNPTVSLLVDVYDEDWTQLWWTRADGHGTVLGPEIGPGARAAAVQPLIDRYPQYQEHPPEGPVVTIAIQRWRGWAARTP